jgi:hypothetical protein
VALDLVEAHQPRAVIAGHENRALPDDPAILVSSPELVRVFCRTPRQIVLANALCRFREKAEGRA